MKTRPELVARRLHSAATGPSRRNGPQERPSRGPRVQAEEEQRLVPRASVALDNLRGFVILLVLSFHSVLAYLNFLPASPYPFNSPPYLWRAFPIVDTARWFGFDLFCAWQDVFLMSLFFLLSGLFVWPSLERKGARIFLHDRLIRLGVPFAFVVALLMPLANYPTYLQTAADPSFVAFWREWLALPFWPCGPMWFLWLLFVADFAAAAAYQFAPQWGNALIRFSSSATSRPGRYFAALVIAFALAYVPLAVVFTPSAWVAFGPFGFQLSRPLHYATYFVAGLGIGACGIERGLFGPHGVLARHWAVWLIAASGLLVVWMVLTALTMSNAGAASLGLQILDDLSFVFACFSSCFAVVALVLRFAGTQLPVVDYLKHNAYGMYLVHYVFVVWLQYALLGVGLVAVAKGAIVFGGTLLLSCVAVAAFRRIFRGDQIVGGRRANGIVTSSRRFTNVERVPESIIGREVL
ncbi:MAG: acyltransferase family protein [Stellaceae bacterium]